MRIGFFHDTTFIKGKKGYYTKGQINSQFLEKYINAFNGEKIITVIKEEEENNINNKYIQDKNLIKNAEVINVKTNYSNAFKKVKHGLEECDYAIIRMPSIIGMFACMLARRKKIPYLIEMVGCPRDSLWYHGGIKFKICMPIITIINKIELKKAKNVIYVTQKFLQKRYKTKGSSISCSDVNLPELDNKILEYKISRINNNHINKIYKFGLVGSLDVDYKGHELAIKGLSKLNKKIKFELHFLGSGNKEKWNELAKEYKIEDKIFFDGVLPHADVFKWMDDLDIYLILSKTEGLPRALIEAMSRACPCIGTNVGGIPELLSKDTIIDKNNYIELAEVIEKLITNKEIMRNCAQDNFKKAKKYQEKELDIIRNRYYKKILERLKNDKSITCSK